MTVSSSTRRAGPFSGNGTATSFPFGFKVFAPSDVAVYLTDDSGVQTLLASNYTVTLNSDQDSSPGGTVNYPTVGDPLPDGSLLDFVGALEYTQGTDLTNVGRFLPDVIEKALDKVTILVQQLLERVGRGVTFPVGDSGSNNLPTVAQRGGMFLAFDADGNPVASSGTGADSGLRTDLAAAAGAALVGTADGGTIAGALTSKLNCVVESIAALRTLLKTRNTRAFVTGYYAAGDGGGGAYYYDPADTSSADNSGSIIVAADGGRWKLAQTFPMSIKQFGAKGDGTTDDRAAIQAAIDAAPTNGTLFIPATNLTFYSVSKNSGGIYCLLVTRPLNFIGEGLYSAINPDATATALVDTICLTPAVGYGFWGMTWDNFVIGNPNTGTRKGRHGIFIDTQVAGSQLPKAIFRRLHIMQGDGTLPTAICHLNDGTNNVNGGMYGAEIVDCPSLKGGIRLAASGDSNIIQRNIITGSGIGVSASLVNGASLLTIVDNNITTDGGQISVSSGSRVKILHNNMEQTGATTGATVMVNLSGDDGTMTMCEVRGNHMGAFTGSGMTANVQIGANVNGTIVEDNTMLNANAGFSGPCVQLIGGNSNRIGFNQYGTNITTAVSDAGAGTMGVKKTLTLQNSWVTQTGFPAPYVFKDITGTVHLHGEIAGGTATAGTVIATLPADFWPSATQDFPTASAAGGTYGVGVFNVNASTGTITIQAGSNGQFGLHASWRAANASKLSSNQ